MTLQSTAGQSDRPTAPVFAVLVLFAAMVGFALLVMAGLSIWHAGTAKAEPTQTSTHALAAQHLTA